MLACSALIRDHGEVQVLERRLKDRENAAGVERILPPLLRTIAGRFAPILQQKAAWQREAADPAQAARIGKLLQSLERAQSLLEPWLPAPAPQATADPDQLVGS